MLRLRSTIGLAILVTLCLSLHGCGGNGGSPQRSAEDYTIDGWAKYGTDDFTGALDDFESAINRDPAYAGAYLGAGWAILNLKNADSAIALFEAGQQATPDSAMTVDFYAALALACFEDEQFTQCIASVGSCLSSSPVYLFANDAAIDYIDLKVACANSHFQLGGDENLATAAELVHEIDPGINLDPATPSTWQVNGTVYETFSEALLRALEHVAQLAG